MRSKSLPLIVGIPGAALGEKELRTLEQVQPAGVLLFSRNVESADQVRRLASSLQDLEPAPFLAVDLEGGAVNRFAGLWGTLPSPARSAAAGRKAVRALGEAAGSACRALGIHLDLAPVIDLECPAGLLAQESRCMSSDPERVVTLARIFLEGLSTWCVGGCLKHFPGLGPVAVDTHLELPRLDLDEEELEPHLNAFAQLSEQVPLVMVGHVVVSGFGDSERPASLSPTVVERAAGLPGKPVVLADDLEMGALDSWGALPERVVAALRARNHGILLSKGFARLPEIAARIEEEIERDPSMESRIEEVSARLGTLRRDLSRTAASIPAPDDATVAQLWEQARREAEP